ncbi:RING finger protein nhl-1-like [Saccostrea echinata]|uniref:RING finger protein nhl-1-like n=1 Tax=Saccostrea echinata TaxID=191078 RepID=UPI002A831CA4|nr:RING finger protein nhl-1-like [Saccostrea echinata]
MENESILEKIIGSEVIGLLKCNICWDIFTEPTILPCGHTFCMGCLNEIGRHRLKNTKVAVTCDITILCPNCRHGVLLDDVNNLKNGVRLNYALSSIKETLTNVQSVPKVDASTNTDTNAVWDEKLKNIEQNMNTAFYELKKRGNVINSAYAQIAKIRECKNQNVKTGLFQENGELNNYTVKTKRINDQVFDVMKSKLNVNQPEFVPRSHANPKQYGYQQGRRNHHYVRQPWNSTSGVIPQYHRVHPAFDPAIVSVYGPAQ